MDQNTSSTQDLSKYPPNVIESLRKQARRYAQQIRHLEDNGMVFDRRQVRKAWTVFADQLSDYDLWWLTRCEYTAAYSLRSNPPIH